MTTPTHDDLAGFDTAKPKAADPLAKLNDKQRLAAETVMGPLVIRAGAGTGKTTTMVARIAHIVRSGAARADQILGVTFTRKAAAELRGRVAAMVGTEAAGKMTLGNFHAIAGDILRRHAPLMGLSQNFTVLDDSGQRDVIGALALERGFIVNKKDTGKIAAFLEQIASWKEEGWTPEDVEAKGDVESLVLDKIGQGEGFGKQALTIFQEYQQMLIARRWCDFADLILHTVTLFKTFPEVRAREAGRYTHIVVDEFQDTSPVQNIWVRLMAQDHANLCVVGDTDQSIYEWRNARPEIMMGFEKDWPGAKAITIDANYRSTQEILDVANAVVAPLRAKDGLDKQLRGFQHGVAPKELFATYTSAMEEAEQIAREADRLIDSGHKGAEIAVLCRSGMIMRHIEKALRDRRMPYVVAGAMKFTDREEVRDALAYLTLAANPMDFVALERIAAKPTRGLGAQKIGAIRRTMIAKRCTVADAIDGILAGMGPRAASRAPLQAFATALRHAEAATVRAANAGDALERVLEESGYWAWREMQTKDPQRELRVENLARLVSEAQGYATAVEFLESMALHASNDMKWTEDCVVLSTVHASKGLEFDTVFTPAMEVGIFPNARSERTSYGADEERRLAHVAWTRARTRLYVSWAKFRPERTGMGEPSPYLEEAGLLDTGRRTLPSVGATGKRIFRPLRF